MTATMQVMMPAGQRGRESGRTLHDEDPAPPGVDGVGARDLDEASSEEATEGAGETGASVEVGDALAELVALVHVRHVDDDPGQQAALAQA